MKIITDTCAYIQRDDMTVLMKCNRPIPRTIYRAVFSEEINIIDDYNRYEFLEFTRPEEIIFFKEADWIVDYNEVKDLSEDEFIKLGQQIVEEKNNIAHKYNCMSSQEKNNNIAMVLQCELLDFKMYALRDVLCFKQGHIKMKLPEGIDYPSSLKKEKGLKQLVKTLINKIQNKPTLI